MSSKDGGQRGRPVLARRRTSGGGRSPMRLSECAAALLAGVLITGLSATQSTQDRPRFRAGVDLVQIDVVALDKDRHPVHGLTPADFMLLDRTKVQQTATFKEMTIGGSGAADPTTAVAHVPDLASGTMVLGSPILGSTQRETGFLVQGPAAVQLPFTPTLDRTFDQTDSLQVFCPLSHRPGAALQVTLSIMTDDDHFVLSATPEVDSSGNQPIVADVSLASLAPGGHRLRVRVTDGHETAQRVRPIVIKSCSPDHAS